MLELLTVTKKLSDILGPTSSPFFDWASATPLTQTDAASKRVVYIVRYWHENGCARYYRKPSTSSVNPETAGKPHDAVGYVMRVIMFCHAVSQLGERRERATAQSRRSKRSWGRGRSRHMRLEPRGDDVVVEKNYKLFLWCFRNNANTLYICTWCVTTRTVLRTFRPLCWNHEVSPSKSRLESETKQLIFANKFV